MQGMIEGMPEVGTNLIRKSDNMEGFWVSKIEGDKIWIESWTDIPLSLTPAELWKLFRRNPWNYDTGT